MEMDDFFMNKEDVPYGPDGLQDLEAIGALNVSLLTERVHRLFAGESVPRRKYDFKQAKGVDVVEKQQKLGPKTFLIFESIHGLKPLLINKLGADKVCPIFVAALTPLAIDSTHRLPSTDLRLIRRIVRDSRDRGKSARQTIRRWTSVRIGETKNIFPLLNNAELFFNSALAYELPVLAVSARSLLAEATVPEDTEDPNDPLTVEITREARRLLTLISFFYEISLEEVPHISCIREFVGGSDLDEIDAHK
jgi:uridine kinase